MRIGYRWCSVALGVAIGLWPSLSSAERRESARQERREEFREHHPRRAEVNDRIHNQRRELNRDLKSGKITQEQHDAEAAKLNEIKKSELSDVKNNGGYLTREQQKGLNQELNQTKKEIKGLEGQAPANGASK